MFKNIGKAMAILLAGAGGGTAISMAEAHKERKAGMSDTFRALYGGTRTSVAAPQGPAKGRTTAAAQRRAKIKRANKRKHPKGSK